jgi:nitrite reductase/ring-hydroxylating ferredoxin subunit
MQTNVPHQCACRHASGGEAGHPSVNRRRFLAVASGCVLGAAGGLSPVTAAGFEPVEIGPLKKFDAEGISEEFLEHDFFVIRHGDKLFAASTTCPHMGHVLYRDPQDPTRILCRGHESVFNAEGLVVAAPASSGLTRLGISVNAQGSVIVNRNKQFAQDKWDDKGSYLVIEQKRP